MLPHLKNVFKIFSSADANLLPEDIYPALGGADGPMATKIKFLYTGSTPMEHDDELELIEELLDDALELHKYLPNLLALGVEAILPTVPKEYIKKDLEGVLRVANDKREAQV